MKLVLDTNILVPETALGSRKLDLLLDFSRRTESTVLIPDVVLEEMEAFITREAEKHVAASANATLFLSRTTGKPLQPVMLPAPTEAAAAYLEQVRTKLRLLDAQILRRKPTYLDQLVHRATRRKKPFNDSGGGFRDGIIWLEVLDIRFLGKGDEVKVCFISKNTKDFGDNDNLHAELREEADAVSLQLQYFSSLDSFLRAHAEPIAFISEEFVSTTVDIGELENEVMQGDFSYFRRSLERWFSRKYSDATGEVRIQSVQLVLDRKLPRRVDGLKLDFSGRILPQGESDEEIEVQRIADCGDSQGRRGRGSRRAAPA